MVGRIYELKNQMLDRIEDELIERGTGRIDVEETGKMIDMVKDLAAAEKDCWKAEYYRAVTEAMGQSGYSSDYPMRSTSKQAHYGSGYQRRGYGKHDDMVESIRMAMRGLPPEKQDEMREQLRMVLEV